jgi:WD40 repeat protein
MFCRIWHSLTVSLLLSNCLALNAADPPKVDSFGDPLPEGVFLRLGTTRLATQSNAVWLPDGKTLVTAKDGMLLFWDVASGKLVRSLPVPVRHHFTLKLGISADGWRIAVGSPSGDICAWNLKSLEIASRMHSKVEGGPERTSTRSHFPRMAKRWRPMMSPRISFDFGTPPLASRSVMSISANVVSDVEVSHFLRTAVPLPLARRTACSSSRSMARANRAC